MSLQSEPKVTANRRIAVYAAVTFLSSRFPGFCFGQDGDQKNSNSLGAFISLNLFLDKDIAQFKPSELGLLGWILDDEEFRKRLKHVSSKLDGLYNLPAKDGFQCEQGSAMASIAFSSDFGGGGKRGLSALEWLLYSFCRGGFIELVHEVYRPIFTDFDAVQSAISELVSEHVAEWKDAQAALMFGKVGICERLLIIGRLREMSHVIESGFLRQLKPVDFQKLADFVAQLQPIWLFLADRVCQKYRGGSPLLGSSLIDE